MEGKIRTEEGFWENVKDIDGQKEGHTGLMFQDKRGSDT
jgi:hypothetical protein